MPFMVLELAVTLVMLAITAILAVVGLLFNFIVAPLRTLATILQKLAGVVGVLAVAYILLAWFTGGHHIAEWWAWAGLGGAILVGIVTQWFLERPTRAERLEAQRRRQEQLDEQRRQEAELARREQKLRDIQLMSAALIAHSRQNQQADTNRVPPAPPAARIPVEEPDPREIPAEQAFIMPPQQDA